PCPTGTQRMRAKLPALRNTCVRRGLPEPPDGPLNPHVARIRARAASGESAPCEKSPGGRLAQATNTRREGGASAVFARGRTPVCPPRVPVIGGPVSAAGRAGR